MCFSATASFATAAATAVAGGFTLAKARGARDVPLASIPLVFAAQQAIEGTIWLLLDHGVTSGPAIEALSIAFLVFAEVLWPFFMPLAVLLVEPRPGRRQIFTALLVVGTALAVHLSIALTQITPGVTIHGQSLRYDFTGGGLLWTYLPYVICTCLPLLLSSHKVLRAAGAVVLTGFAVTVYVHYTALVSVWCFFAAATSTLLYVHFQRAATAAHDGTLYPKAG